MNKLWAPWRMKYLKITGQKGCIFCKAKRSSHGSYVVFKTRYCLCMLNIYPYNNGHTMIAPLRHVRGIEFLKNAEKLDLFNATDTATKLLDKVLKPHGYNIGINISDSAGAGIPQHLHIHIVPRWKGDTNFMAVIYDTKVICQSLTELLAQLKNAYSK